MLHVANPKDSVREMKALAETLMLYTPPTYPRDEDISWFKSREIIVDGVPVIVNYSISDHGDLKPCVLTICCKNVPFIAFTIVCKIAKMFLGNENLTLFEYTKSGIKFYSWMVLLKKGNPVEIFDSEKLDKVNYQGFNFVRCYENEQLNFQ